MDFESNQVGQSVPANDIDSCNTLSSMFSPSCVEAAFQLLGYKKESKTSELNSNDVVSTFNDTSEYPECSQDQIQSCRGKCSKEVANGEENTDGKHLANKHKKCISFCLKLQVVATDSKKDHNGSQQNNQQQ